MITVLTVLTITIAFYLTKRHYKYWERRGVPGPKPKFLVGNIGELSLTSKKSPYEIYIDIYREYKNVPLVGIFRASTPSLIIRDPELIKDITVKSFNHFQDNDRVVDKKVDPLFGRHPFSLKGEEWKTVRAQLTPAFTSGKMKWIYPHIENMSQQLINFIKNQPPALNGEGYEVKELCYRFTLNNVACCAFGIEGKCLEEENSDFRQLAHDFFTPGTWLSLLFFVYTIFPPIIKLIPIRFVEKGVEGRLMSMVIQTIKYRQDNDIKRNDFLHILHQLKNTSKDYKFTDLDITAHVAGFLGDGYETSAGAMSFLLYELAANPNIQSKLREEINHHFRENGNKLPYEVLLSLPYLDACLRESMRIHTPIFALQKVCTKPYNYVPKSDNGIIKPFTIQKDTTIILPTHGLHNDSQYFKDPEIYDPERFLGDNKNNITRCTFMPFGEGPRSCLGQRFGLLQVKAGIAYIIKNYELSVSEKTKLPFEYDIIYLVAHVKGGLWLDFKEIDAEKIEHSST